MSWFRVDDSFADHPKVARLYDEHPRVADAAVALFMLAGAWSSRHSTDGRVSGAVLRRLRGGRSSAGAVRALLDVGLLDPVPTDAGEHVATPSSRRRGDGVAQASQRADARATPSSRHREPREVQLHDFNDYNPSAAESAQKRRATAERVAAWRARRNGAGNTLQGDPCNAAPVPTRPDPIKNTGGAVDSRAAGGEPPVSAPRAHPPAFEDPAPRDDPGQRDAVVAILAGGYRRRYEARTRDLWTGLDRARRDVDACARYVLTRSHREERPVRDIAEQWLDAMFAIPRYQRARWPWRWAAEDPAKVLADARGEDGPGLSIEEIRQKYGRSPTT